MIQPRRLLIAGVALIALAAALDETRPSMFGERSVYVHVRWAPSVDPATQEQIERAHGLTRVEFHEQRTWAYYLTDVSTENIRRLVGNPAIEDTQYIDRSEFRIAPTATRGPYTTAWPEWIPETVEFAVRASLLAGVFAIAFATFNAWRHRQRGGTPSSTAVSEGGWFVAGRRVDGAFLLILLAALLLRLHLASIAPYIHDEENTAIPLSKSISFAPGQLNLPLRGENHGALPAYVTKASSTLFGTTPLGYRSLHVLLGLGTIVLVYVLTSQAYGALAARWAASLLAFNEYFLFFSARATANTPYLFLVTAAVYAFSRFLATERAVHLYLAAVAIGLAFYCKEHAVLLLPVFLLMLLGSRYRHWWRRPHFYMAFTVFVLLIGPDLAWNLRTDPDTAHVTYSGQYLGQATYSAHLKRIGGIGLSPYPSMFYAHSPVTWLRGVVTGKELPEVAPEYHSLNPALGMLLVGAVLVSTFRPIGRDPVRGLLLLIAWGVFAFFTFIKRGDPPYHLAPVSWVWVEVTLIPAVILAGARVARLTGKRRIAVWTLGAVALLYAVNSVTWGPMD